MPESKSKKKNNPYNISFGKTPYNYINRYSQTDEIVDDFISETPSSQAYIISGVRGSGKTVLMKKISDALLDTDDSFSVIRLDINRDMLEQLASELYNMDGMMQLLKSAKLDFSFFNFGLSIDGGTKITDLNVATRKMLEHLKTRKKKLLIMIDEVAKNENMKNFAGVFQSYVSDDYPVFLIMCGLYENISDLQNDKLLTFLLRTPQVRLEPLNYTAIKKNYMNSLNLSSEQAELLSSYTKGYSYAFQLLGYLYYKKKDSETLDDILSEYELRLSDHVYGKIWSTMSERDKDVMYAIAINPGGKIENIRNYLHMGSSEFTTYKKRMYDKGIISSKSRGYISIVLPLFDQFTVDTYRMEHIDSFLKY